MYVGGDPINRIDPTGTTWICVGYSDDFSCHDDGGGDDQSGVGGTSTVTRQGPKRNDPDTKGLDPREWFQAGFDDAWFRLTQGDCAQALNNQGLTDRQVINALMNETFVAEDLGVATGTVGADGASQYDYSVATVLGSHVTLNGDIFFSPESVTVQLTDPSGSVSARTVNLVTSFALANGLNPATFSAADFQALFILHELGHTLGGLKSDAHGTPAQNTQNSLDNDTTVLTHCFKDK
jgi:hypothetical protein